MPYPFFDPACIYYEALRAGLHDQRRLSDIIEQYGLTEYGYRSAQAAFHQWGTAGLIGLGAKQLTEPLRAFLDAHGFPRALDSCDQDGLDPERLWSCGLAGPDAASVCLLWLGAGHQAL